MGWLLSLILMCLFFGIPIASLCLTGVKDLAHSISKTEKLLMCALALGTMFVVIALMAKERFVYYWDYGAYWYKTLALQDRFSFGFLDSLKSLLYSIESAEYNDLACTIIALPLKLFGNSYFAFVTLNTALFYIPNAFLMAFVLFKIMQKYSLHIIRAPWVCAYTLLFSAALHPILLGQVDIVGMLPLTTAYLLVIDRDFEKTEVAKDVLLGASVLWVVLLRRYYAYAVVGGGVFALFFWIAYGTTKKAPLYRLDTKLNDTLIAVSVPVSMLVLFFRNFLGSSLLNDHYSAYSAYKTTGYFGEWINFVQYFGLLFIGLMLLGIISHIRGDIGKLTIGLVLGLLAGCTLFFRIQDMAAHHYYIVVFPVCCFIFLGIHSLLSLCRKRRLISLGAKGLIALAVAGNFLMSMGCGTAYRNLLWQGWMYTPRIRYDISALNDLEANLEKLSDDGYHGVYCIASSATLNSSILFNLNAPNRNPRISYFGDAHVDLRDGFYTSFFEADIIIACDPVQFHLPHGQEVILKLNEVMLTDNVFSENYEKKDAFVLDNGVQAIVYVKKDALDTEDVEYIRSIYEEIYPDRPELFSNRINDYIMRAEQSSKP